MGVIVFDRSHFQSKSVVSAVAQFQVCSASFFQLLSDCLTPPTFLRDWPHLDWVHSRSKQCELLNWRLALFMHEQAHVLY